MEYRKPYNVDRIIQVYNLFQVVANGYLTFEVIFNILLH